MINPEENKALKTDDTEETTKSVDHNTHDEHMRIDEEGNEVSPEDQAQQKNDSEGNFINLKGVKHIKINMNNFFRGLIAAWGAKKLGGGCLSTIIIFVVIYSLLGKCNNNNARAANINPAKPSISVNR